MCPWVFVADCIVLSTLHKQFYSPPLNSKHQSCTKKQPALETVLLPEGSSERKRSFTHQSICSLFSLKTQQVEKKNQTALLYDLGVVSQPF